MSEHMTECRATAICPMDQPTKQKGHLSRAMPTPMPASDHVSMQSHHTQQGKKNRRGIVQRVVVPPFCVCENKVRPMIADDQSFCI